MEVSLTVNGIRHALDVDPVARLLDVLREHLRLTGTKEGCGEGECGACSVLLDGVPVVSCLVPMGQVDGGNVLTIEGLRPAGEGLRPAGEGLPPAGEGLAGSADRLTSLQDALLAEGGTQCGICTPGIMITAHALLASRPRPTPDEIREALAGNLCRCTGYAAIVEALRHAAEMGP
jgi:carbon-monoxide dehydrogenase small subunit